MNLKATDTVIESTDRNTAVDMHWSLFRARGRHAGRVGHIDVKRINDNRAGDRLDFNLLIAAVFEDTNSHRRLLINTLPRRDDD